MLVRSLISFPSASKSRSLIFSFSLLLAQDWHKLWIESSERTTVQREIDEFHSKYGSKESAADAAVDSNRAFAAHTSTQLMLVTQRAFQNYWRDSNYIVAKIMLNISAGLFIGFSFWKSPDDISGLQNRLFAVFSRFSFLVSRTVYNY